MSGFDRVAIIGLGLIGGSIAWALRRHAERPFIVGFARSEESREKTRELGFCDEVADSAADAVKDADLVILCVPVGAMQAVASEISPHLAKGAVITDVGSVKRAVVDALSDLPDHVHIVPAHPLAGTEFSGPDSGFAELFDDKYTLITPLEGGDDAAKTRLMDFWRSLGAKVREMDAERHDLVLAVVSHAPHLIAYTMVGVADHMQRVTNDEVIEFSASGFRDFTRIAASDPTMWRDVFLTNKDATLEILGRFTEELFALQRAIRTGDGDMLFDYFTRTRAIRQGIIEAGQDTSAPDFGRMPKRDA
ncbi:MAG: prephenate/arogenate dehydrogenase family protein [Pseudomonadota bacterium]